MQLLCTVLEVSHASSWALQKSACTVDVEARELGDEAGSSLAAWLSRYVFLVNKLSVHPHIGREHSTEQLVSQALQLHVLAPAPAGSSTAPPHQLHLSALSWSYPQTFSVLRAAQASKELTSLTLYRIDDMTPFAPCTVWPHQFAGPGHQLQTRQPVAVPPPCQIQKVLGRHVPAAAHITDSRDHSQLPSTAAAASKPAEAELVCSAGAGSGRGGAGATLPGALDAPQCAEIGPCGLRSQCCSVTHPAWAGGRHFFGFASRCVLAGR